MRQTVKWTHTEVAGEASADPVGNLEAGVAPLGLFRVETQGPHVYPAPVDTGPIGGHVTLARLSPAMGGTAIRKLLCAISIRYSQQLGNGCIGPKRQH